MATVFQNSRWRRQSSWIFPKMLFRRHRYFPNRSPNVSTNFGDDGSNTKEMAAVFRNPTMAAAAILKSTLPVESAPREMNSLFEIFNTKFNFYWGILTFNGSLLLAALMLKQFFAGNQKVQTFTGRNLAIFWTGDSFIVNLKAPKPRKARVLIRTRLLSHSACNSYQNCALWTGRGNGKKAGEESHKTVIFLHHVEAPFCYRSAPNLVSL